VQDYRAGPRDSGRIVLFHLVAAPALHARATTAAERGLERVVVLILNARVIVCVRVRGGGVGGGVASAPVCVFAFVRVSVHSCLARALSTCADAHVCTEHTLNPTTLTLNSMRACVCAP
jgi:hypothetical protein